MGRHISHGRCVLLRHTTTYHNDEEMPQFGRKDAQEHAERPEKSACGEERLRMTAMFNESK